jgi:hypothetical protein
MKPPSAGPSVLQNYQWLHSWIKEQAPDEVLRIHNLAHKHVCGTTNIMVVDDCDGSQKRSIGPSPCQRFEKIQRENGLNFASTIKAAKARRTRTFPFVVAHMGVLDSKLVQVMKSCDLPFVTSKTSAEMNKVTKMTDDEVLAALGFQDVSDLDDEEALSQAVTKMLNAKPPAMPAHQPKAIDPAVTGEVVRRAWLEVVDGMVNLTKAKMMFKIL